MCSAEGRLLSRRSTANCPILPTVTAGIMKVQDGPAMDEMDFDEVRGRGMKAIGGDGGDGDVIFAILS